MWALTAYYCSPGCINVRCDKSSGIHLPTAYLVNGVYTLPFGVRRLTLKWTVERRLIEVSHREFAKMDPPV